MRITKDEVKHIGECALIFTAIALMTGIVFLFIAGYAAGEEGINLLMMH